MSQSEPTVAVIVLTWNNFTDTDECLRSLTAVSYPATDIVLVDNGSTDGSPERLEAEWGRSVRFLRVSENLGVAGGFNTGIRAALDSGSDYVLLLNNDAVVEPGLIEALLPAFDAVPRLATVSPMITYYDDPGRLWFAGATYHRRAGISRHRFLAKPLSTADPVLGRLFATDYVPNCAAMTPRRVYDDVGLLDERFFLGQEDVDWGLRLREAGYEARVVGRPLVAHKVSASAGVRGSNVLSPAQAYHYARGSMLIAAKWARGPSLGAYLAGQLLVRLPYYSAQAARHNRWASIPAYLRGLRDGYRSYLMRSETSPS